MGRWAFAARRLPPDAAFGAVCLATVTVSVVVGVPAPLNTLYAERYGATPAVFSGAFAVYVVCAALSMAVFGRLSDQLGRRRAGIIALAFSFASCVAFLLVRDAAGYLFARALAGFGVGLGMSALGAFAVDLTAARHARAAALLTSAAAPVGTAVGAIGSGALAQFAPVPLVLGFVLAGALVLACIVGIWFAPETVPRSVRTPVTVVPVVGVPRRLVAPFVGGCLCFVACWALGGLFQSLGATIATEMFGATGGMAGGAVSAAVIGPSVVGGLATSALPSRRALAIGVVSFVLGVAGIVLGAWSALVAVFVAGSVLAGLGFGASFNACMRVLLAAAGPRETARLLSAAYLVGFLGSALPNSLAGVAVAHLGLGTVVETYATGAGLLVVAGGLIAGRQRVAGP